MLNSTLNCYEQSVLSKRELPTEWQEQYTLDELSDFLQLNWEQRSVFFDDELGTKQQYLSFYNNQSVRTNNYIGSIVFKGQQLNIFPKVFRENKNDDNTDNLSLDHLMKNLVNWLKYCNRFDYPFIHITSELESSKNLKELFITLYLYYVKKAIERSPFYRYEDRVEDLETIRGHLDLKDYICNKIPKGQGNKFRCSYSEFEFDNIINRIIKYTCRSLMNDTESNNNKNIIRHILIRLNDVSDVRVAPSDCDNIRLSKFHRHFSIILSMSKMFLLNQTSTYKIDNQESFCFLFPTELLFEGFVGGFMQEYLEDKARVRLQASDLPLIDDILYSGKSFGKAFTMRHDILVEHKEKGLYILDTKYKHMSRFEGNTNLKRSLLDEISQADLYQMLEYAAHRGCSDIYLLYPMYRFEDEEPYDVILKSVNASGIETHIHVVRIPFIFEQDLNVTSSRLIKTINNIF